MAKVRNIKLTDEQKARFEPMLHQVWNSVGPDCETMGNMKVSDIVEIVCDAHRPIEFGGMSREDYAILLRAYRHRDTQKWLRSVLNY